MSVFYKYGSTSACLFPVMPHSTDKMYMAPLWCDGKTKMAYPHDCIHLIQTSHDSYTITAQYYKTSSPQGSYYSNTSDITIQIKENGTTKMVTVDGTDFPFTNPAWTWEFGKSDRRFDSHKFASNSDAAWPGTAGNNPLWKNDLPQMDAQIYENVGGTNPAGFVIALDKSGLWPSSTNGVYPLMMGMIFKVPKGNTKHSITLFYKGSSYKKIRQNYWMWPGNSVKKILSRYVEDADVNGWNVALNMTDQKNVKLICTDNSYKFFYVKGCGSTKKGVDGTHFFSMPHVLYSGNKSGLIEAPIVVDAWIGIRPYTS